MKAKLLAFLAIFLLGGGAALYDLWVQPEVSRPQEPSVGIPTAQPAPPFETRTLDGAPLALAGLHEPVILLNFWASWCSPCLAEFPAMLRLVESYEGAVALVAISTDDDRKAIAPFLEKLERLGKMPTRAPHVYWAWDDKKRLSREIFHTIRVPETIILNKERNMVKKIAGITDWQGEEIRGLLDGLAEEE